MFKKFLPFLLLPLLCCTTPLPIDALPNRVPTESLRPAPPKDPAEAVVVVRVPGGLGMGVFVSKDTVMSARHITEGEPWVLIQGQKTTSWTNHKDRDLVTIHLSSPIEDALTIPIAKAELGMAELYTHVGGRIIAYRILIRVEHTKNVGCSFIGFRPIPGQSGSPILQNGKVVGIVTQLDLPHGGFYEPIIDLE